VQLRDSYADLAELGELAAIGMGEIEAARAFKSRWQIPFPLLVDRRRESYRALGLRTGNLAQVAGPRVWAPFIAGIARGRGVAVGRQNIYQLGGAAVVTPGGKVVFSHRAANSADNAPVAELLAALRRAAQRT
jgi:hypothetical protein